MLDDYTIKTRTFFLKKGIVSDKFQIASYKIAELIAQNHTLFG